MKGIHSEEYIKRLKTAEWNTNIHEQTAKTKSKTRSRRPIPKLSSVRPNKYPYDMAESPEDPIIWRHLVQHALHIRGVGEESAECSSFFFWTTVNPSIHKVIVIKMDYLSWDQEGYICRCMIIVETVLVPSWLAVPWPTLLMLKLSGTDTELIVEREIGWQSSPGREPAGGNRMLR